MCAFLDTLIQHKNSTALTFRHGGKEWPLKNFRVRLSSIMLSKNIHTIKKKAATFPKTVVFFNVQTLHDLRLYCFSHKKLVNHLITSIWLDVYNLNESYNARIFSYRIQAQFLQKLRCRQKTKCRIGECGSGYFGNS